MAIRGFKSVIGFNKRPTAVTIAPSFPIVPRSSALPESVFLSSFFVVLSSPVNCGAPLPAAPPFKLISLSTSPLKAFRFLGISRINKGSSTII